MSLRRINHLTGLVLLEDNKKDELLKKLLSNLAMYKDVGDGFTSFTNLKIISQFALVNSYIIKKEDGSYSLTNLGVKKLRSLGGI